jgi:Cysteine rich repeat
MADLLRTGALVWSGLVLAALTTPLAAQQPTSAQQNAVRQNCRSDFQAHCSGVPTGGSAALKCLQQNAASLSDPCQQALSAIGGSRSAHPAQSAAPGEPAAAPPLSRRQRAYILRQACGMDFQTDCHGVPLGGGHAIECLAAHRETLSPGCQRALASARQ